MVLILGLLQPGIGSNYPDETSTNWIRGGTCAGYYILDDLKAIQKDILETKDIDELQVAFIKWRKIG